ncbi:MAG TPA: saccharopine dehydrogenase NADP-binding domain-containing protein, partial [Thermoanaerobaculia bacterium]|nr:saccharopine dehydrogenase NADP-binding domain-containing protein [Thermoanaerobaculia bacterium]
MWMIYGANGYTGELIAREAARRGMRPILAGRSAERVEPLARELGLESRVFPVTQPNLDGVTIVLHCAGPFVRTSGPMVRACLDAGAAYLDITGEIEVYETVLAKHEEAIQRGALLLPGVGFDVVPTDCLGAMLAQRLPDATELWLAFSSGAGLSRGTIKTMIEGAGEGGAIRRDGRIVRVPMLFDVREIPYKSKPRLSMTIPWGDVSTA